MIRKIAYIGFGDLGRQVSLFLKQVFPGEINEIYFDDNLFSTQQQNSFPFSKYTDQQFDSYDFYICLGYKNLELKTKIFSEMKTAGRRLPHFIHPSVIINPSATIGAGVIIYPGCNIDQHVILEDGVLLNNSVTISHNSIIGKSSFLAPGVVISGNVKIGKENFIGSGTVVSNNIELGDNVITGIGTVITKSVTAGSSVIGNPMKILTEKIKLK
jgi:sugar O-acyltransferase (sialic acid O-acetyltransferase NeuD family)